MAVATPVTVEQIADAIAKQLSDGGIRALPYLSDSFSPPVAVVGIDTADYHVAFGFVGLYTFTVWLILARASDRAALTAMEGYMNVSGDLSVRSLLESDVTLGGTVDFAKVSRAGPPSAITINGSPYTSVPFTVECQI